MGQLKKWLIYFFFSKYAILCTSADVKAESFESEEKLNCKTFRIHFPPSLVLQNMQLFGGKKVKPSRENNNSSFTQASTILVQILTK